MGTVAVILICVISVFASVASAVAASVILSARNERERRTEFLAESARQSKSADRMLEVNKRTAETAQVMSEKLDNIYTFVNSNLTVVRKSELDATVRVLALLKEVTELRRAAGHEPSRDSLIAIAATERKIRELRMTLDDQ